MQQREPIVLYTSEKDCCACGACLNSCPKNAITMAEDDCGFLYPQIDEALCVRCGRCQQVCAFQHTEVTNSPVAAFAALGRRVRRRRAEGRRTGRRGFRRGAGEGFLRASPFL